MRLIPTFDHEERDSWTGTADFERKTKILVDVNTT